MITIALALFSPEASACGGFFCNREFPIKQQGETIVFEVDEVLEQTTMHIQVTFEGPAAEFAWIIPVKGTPDLALSHQLLFMQLERSTRPSFQVQQSWLGECPPLFWDVLEPSVFGDINNDDLDDVTVLAQSQVGPYDTVVIEAQQEGALVDWLQVNGYSVPDGMESVLGPYLADGHNFVALKLSSGNDIGDLEPLSLTYAGVEPSIPLHLTKVAAAEDMPITAFVIGGSRAVPENYLHVEINEAAIDWYGQGSNYPDLVTRAADEAGGHAFATDFAGSTESFDGLFFSASYQDLTLDEATGALDFLQRVISSGLPATAELESWLTRHISVPAGTTPRSVFDSPSSYPVDDWNPDFDVNAALVDLDHSIVGPLRSIQEMFDRQPHITRLRSSISPSEMTLDPRFTLNADIIQSVARDRIAISSTDCKDLVDWDSYQDAHRKLELPGGNTLALPTIAWLQEHGMTESSWMARLEEPAASRIESFGSTGPAEVLFDGSLQIRGEIGALNREVDGLERTRGCDVAGGAALGWLAVIGPLFLRRRS